MSKNNSSSHMPGLVFIGTIHTPYKTMDECPRNVQEDGPHSTIELDERYAEGLSGLEGKEYIQVLYWLDMAQRDILTQTKRGTDQVRGTFSLRSPHRPNPIGSAVVKLVGMEGNKVTVVGMDCVDGTPLLDIKPAMLPDAEKTKKA